MCPMVHAAQLSVCIAMAFNMHLRRVLFSGTDRSAVAVMLNPLCCFLKKFIIHKHLSLNSMSWTYILVDNANSCILRSDKEKVDR